MSNVIDPCHHLDFPPIDTDVKIWFNKPVGPNGIPAWWRPYVFLIALFQVAASCLSNIDKHMRELEDDGWSAPGPDTILPEKFRFLMTVGQMLSSRGHKRAQFYKDVLERTEAMTVSLILCCNVLLRYKSGSEITAVFQRGRS